MYTDLMGIMEEFSRTKYSEQELREAVVKAKSLKEVHSLLGLSSPTRVTKRKIKALGLDTSHFSRCPFTGRDQTYPDLGTVVASSTSVSQVIQFYGLAVSGSTYSVMRRRILRRGIPTSHFVADRSHVKTQMRSAEEVLRVHPEGTSIPTRAMLHRSLQSIGVPEECVSCAVGTLWQGRPITLQVDHISGERRDCRAENLRYLCPNCHSQTETWGNRGVARPVKSSPPCPKCHTPMAKGSKQCQACQRVSKATKIAWPSRSYVEARAAEIGLAALGRELGVSDNSIRKRLRNPNYS